MDFTWAKYEHLCEAIVESPYETTTLAGYLKNPCEGAALIIRHDVDRSPGRALDMARIEHDFGIRATYYFRANRGTYVPRLLDEIARLGHEIGYHYETVDEARGDLDRAVRLFGQRLNDFRGRYCIETVCAHGNPLTPYDNKDIWKRSRLSDYGLLGEAFLSLDYSRFAYFSDSGRTWLKTDSQKMPGKDSVPTAFDFLKPITTDDVIRIVGAATLPNICILAHPERWTGDIFAFAGRYVLDTTFSWGKIAIHAYRRLSRNGETTVHSKHPGTGAHLEEHYHQTSRRGA